MLLKWLKRFFHIHNYNKILVSQYWTFHSRMVIVECKCGKRHMDRRHVDLVYPFPTTTLITDKEMKDILANGMDGYMLIDSCLLKKT